MRLYGVMVVVRCPIDVVDLECRRRESLLRVADREFRIFAHDGGRHGRFRLEILE